MRSAKKSMLMLLVLVFTMSLVLAACAGSNNSNSGGNTSTGESSNNTSEGTGDGNSAASNLEPYELKMVFPATKQKDHDVVMAKINEYLKEKINATIDIQPIEWGQWDEKVNLMIASQEPMDIFFTAQWSNYAVNVSKGAFLELDDLLANTEAGQSIVNSLDPAFINGSKIDGKNYGIPTNKELAASAGYIYRTDIAEELGLNMDSVKSNADLGPILQKVKEAKPEMIPLFFRDGENFNVHYLAEFDYLGDANIPGVLLKDDPNGLTVRPRHEIDRYLENLKLAHEYFRAGYINQDATTTTLSAQDAMKAGNVFMIPASLKPGKDIETESATGLIGKLRQIEVTGATIATSETAGSMLAISRTSDNPERAMMFINLLHTDKYLNNLLNFGIEGEHYALNGDSMMTPTEKTADYALGSAWMLGSMFLNNLWETEDPQKWEQYKEFNASGTVSPGLGFTFNAEPVKTQVAQIVNVRKEYDAQLDTGAVNPDEVLPRYIEKLEAAGLRDIIAEKQRQFDEFKANQ
ncbi:extracellular solute-binding protein [Xylanibacillus composti]|uniref:ABC transporter substrate-binding protein n=1 Tax=Xylanibacillus composti TaxID=1572762 RepID=A0A8J4H327_9BACL|nr:ABC transporter substrate-binding protein [Xylanibacillus composti]MDT9724423.1 extracellular solute-binding protein [Xylanibacillus composti]GIQ68019.1 ABC transporter substrate-binding protein [Xylanibacillus composti]